MTHIKGNRQGLLPQKTPEQRYLGRKANLREIYSSVCREEIGLSCRITGRAFQHITTWYMCALWMHFCVVYCAFRLEVPGSFWIRPCTLRQSRKSTLFGHVGVRACVRVRVCVREILKSRGQIELSKP